MLRDCLELRHLDATQYWFWHAYFGLADEQELDGQRTGRLALDPRVCFRASVVGLDKAAYRTRGYRQAVEELIKWVAEADAVEPDSNSLIARVQLQKITGRPLADFEEWMEWWRENREYLWWSEEAGILAVDESAKRAGAPLHDDALVLDAEEYWFYAGRGWISQPRELGDYVLGNVLVPPHGYQFRAIRSELDDPDAKRRGYLRAVENLIFDGLMLPELQQSSLAVIIERLTELTDRSFTDRDSWLQWWQRYGERLALSADGERLITPAQR